MGNSTFPLLCCLAAAFLGASRGNDPFEGNFPRLNCIKPRQITGCNESLVDAYNRTEASKSDQNGNVADTSMFLFTRRNEKCAEFLHRCGGRLPSNTNFKADQPIIFIVGGYISTVCDLAYFRELMYQLLCRGDYNVILVDWPWGNYYDIYSSIRNAEVVGKQMAFVIKQILEQTGASPDAVHIIGHSVGAHIAGFAGMYFRRFTGGGMIGRITGLDPASAVYLIEPPDRRLDKTDATYVDVIHTNAGDCLLYAIGTYKQSGHADFYVNGGSVQLSCYPHILESFLKGDFFEAFASFFPPLCFHFQSIEYFKASINPGDCLFVGVECNSLEEWKSGKCRSCGADGSKCAVMGMDWKPQKPGNFTYYLHTGIKCPYCKNDGIDLQGFASYAVPKGNTSCRFNTTENLSEKCH